MQLSIHSWKSASSGAVGQQEARQAAAEHAYIKVMGARSGRFVRQHRSEPQVAFSAGESIEVLGIAYSATKGNRGVLKKHCVKLSLLAPVVHVVPSW